MTALRQTARSRLLSAHKRLRTNANVHLEAFVSRSLELRTPHLVPWNISLLFTHARPLVTVRANQRLR